MKQTMNILLTIVVIYLVACTLLYIFQDKFIFFPQKLTVQQVHWINQQYPGTEITFETPDQTKLHGWLIESEHPENNPLVIYYGGNAEEVSASIIDIEKAPQISCLFVNYRGFGLSEGHPSEKNLLADALFIFDEIVKTNSFDRDNIFLMGRSLGSGVAVFVASKRSVRGVILVSPFDSLVNIAKKHYPIFPVSLLVRHRFDSLSRAPKINAPLIVLASNDDQTIPKKHSMTLLKAWKGQTSHHIVQGADHNTISTYPDYWVAINKFVETNKK